MVSYDPEILQHFADRLYRKADSIVISCMLSAAGIGAFAGYLIGFNHLSALAGFVVGGLIGGALGKARSFHLRLQAQLTLCQKSIEQNTRQSASADNTRLLTDVTKATATAQTMGTQPPLPLSGHPNVSQGRKSAAALAVVGVLLVIVIAGVWFAPRRTALASWTAAASHSSASPASPSAIPVHDEIEVEAGKDRSFTLTPPEGTGPGWLMGSWASKGKSAAIPGAHDDSLIAFKIIGPDNKVIDKKIDHPMGGSFKLRYDGPGAYTLVFANSGILRSSARVVELDGSYQPD